MNETLSAALAPSVSPSRRRETTRQRLLDAAAEVFAESGVDAASVEAICERAGFTRGAFYSNFETKDELMLAVTERIAEEKIALVTRRAEELSGGATKLSPSELIDRMLEAAFDGAPEVLLTNEIRLRALRDPRLAPAFLAWQSGMIERLARIIADLGRRHGLRPRLPADEFAALILQTWEDTTVLAKIAGRTDAEGVALVRERTARLATALIDRV